MRLDFPLVPSVRCQARTSRWMPGCQEDGAPISLPWPLSTAAKKKRSYKKYLHEISALQKMCSHTHTVLEMPSQKLTAVLRSEFDSNSFFSYPPQMILSPSLTSTPSRTFHLQRSTGTLTRSTPARATRVSPQGFEETLFVNTIFQKYEIRTEVPD